MGAPLRKRSERSSVTALTHYRWRKEFGGLKSDQMKRLKDLEKETSGYGRLSRI